LLEAFDILSRRMPLARLVIGGDGPELAAVKERIGTTRHRDRVEFLGRVNRTDVPKVLRECTVYCLPSHGEPFGMTALEAMACGKPLVVTDAGGLGYMVSDQGGVRVPLKDATALSKALEELLSDPELCRRMGEYNRAQIEKHYAWPIVAMRLEDIYQQVIGSGSRANRDRITSADIAEYRSRLAASTTSRRFSKRCVQPTELTART
jgi:L-malate glycosyltransferase